MDFRDLFVFSGALRVVPKFEFSYKENQIHYFNGDPVFVGDLPVEIANLANGHFRIWSSISHDLAYEIGGSVNAANIFDRGFDIFKRYTSRPLAGLLSVLLMSVQGGADPWKAFSSKVSETLNLCKTYFDTGSVSEELRHGVTLNVNIIADDKNNLTVTYSSKDFLSVVAFHLLRMQELSIYPKKCEMCGRWFNPVSRSDEIYCRNEYRNGRTCSEVAFEINSKNDPYYVVYRRAYQTFQQRLRRMQMTTEERKVKLKKWRSLAEQKREECKTMNDIDGFLTWLRDNEQ